MKNAILQEQTIEKLWSELTSIENIDERIIAIYNDTISKSPNYQVLAEGNPQRLFELLERMLRVLFLLHCLASIDPTEQFHNQVHGWLVFHLDLLIVGKSIPFQPKFQFFAYERDSQRHLQR